jgi:cytoskeletal protein RodZ
MNHKSGRIHRSFLSIAFVVTLAMLISTAILPTVVCAADLPLPQRSEAFDVQGVAVSQLNSANPYQNSVEDALSAEVSKQTRDNPSDKKAEKKEYSVAYVWFVLGAIVVTGVIMIIITVKIILEEKGYVKKKYGDNR